AATQLLEKNLEEQCESMTASGVKLVAIGQIKRLPPCLRLLIEELQEEAKAEAGAEPGMTSCLAISYGGRLELAEAAKRLVEMSAAGEWMRSTGVMPEHSPAGPPGPGPRCEDLGGEAVVKPAPLAGGLRGTLCGGEVLAGFQTGRPGGSRQVGRVQGVS
ncbi:unnamed protein product, partial [Discosporangium mesarthrocarpum]